MNAQIDHVVCAGSDMDALRDSFEAIGLLPTFGGEHSNEVTFNYIVAFENGTYLELISKSDPSQHSPWWNAEIDNDAGLCAWAIRTDDIERHLSRIEDAGIDVRGPNYYNRERPDGTLVEWDLAELGEGELGKVYPFLISDRTPLSYRIPFDEDTTPDSLTGITEVVVAVADAEAYVERFSDLFGENERVRTQDADFGAELTRLVNSPVTLATPLAAGNWIDDRLERFGSSVCACLLESTDFETAVDLLGSGTRSNWFEDDVYWLDFSTRGNIGILDR